MSALNFKARMIPRLYASLPTGNVFLRFTSGVTPVDLLAASMAAEPFDPHTCTCVQALVGLEPSIICATCTNCLSHPGMAPI